jgi:hypothetical protein
LRLNHRRILLRSSAGAPGVIILRPIQQVILGLVHRRLLSGALALALGLTLAPIARAGAESTADNASQLSDRAFNLLNSVNAQGSPQALTGPVANFAADAQALSEALGSGDKAGASSAMASLETDRAAVDSAIKGSANTAAWDALKQRLDVIAETVPAKAAIPLSTTASSAPAGPPAASVAGLPPIAPASSAPPAAPPERIGPMPASAFGAPPKAVIESRDNDSNGMRIKGFLEGSELTSAGIYQDGQLLKPITIHPVNGEQRLDFDIGLGDAGPGMSIRVADAQGRSAEAFVSAPTTAAGTSANESMTAPSGVEVDRPAPRADTEASATGTAEIPTHGQTRPSPSKRHTIQSHLGDVQIDVIAVRQIAVTPPMYEVLGTIQGRDVTRAAIYIDGRLAAPLPTSSSASVNSIDQRFVADGRTVTIRAFGVGNTYVERPIDLSTAVASASPIFNPMSNPMAGGADPIANGAPGITGAPANAVPGTIAIHIESVTRLSPGRTVVKGQISGRGVQTIGLYQNGMLDQNIPVTAGGGLLGSVISHFGTQTVPFTAFYNPANGPAVIRATDSSGAFTEQPIALGGVSDYMSAPPVVNNAGSSVGGSSW